MQQGMNTLLVNIRGCSTVVFKLIMKEKDIEFLKVESIPGNAGNGITSIGNNGCKTYAYIDL